MLLFAVTMALITAIAFGVVPAMLMARGDMQRPLKESGSGGDGSGMRRRARSALVVAEIGLAVMLLVGAALLARSFQRLVQQDPGFKPAHAVTARVELAVLVLRLAEDRGLLRSPLDCAARGARRVDRRRQQLPAARGGVAGPVLHSRTAAAEGRRRAAGAASDDRRRLLPRDGRAARQGAVLRPARYRRRRRARSSSTRRSRAGSGPGRIRSGSLSCRRFGHRSDGRDR